MPVDSCHSPAPFRGLQPVSRAELAEGFGALGVTLFAVTAWSTPLGNRIALGLCLAALALSPEARAALYRDSFCRYAVMLVVYLVAETLWGATLFPETLERQLLDLATLVLLLLGFLAVAWWLQGSLARINRVLALAALGLWVGLIPHAQLRDVLTFRTGDQTGFQMSAGCSGLISASVILGLLLFAEPWLTLSRKPWQIALRGLVWAAGLYLSAYMLVASQSRTAWLAAGILFPLVFCYRYYRNYRYRGFSLRQLPYLPVMVVVIFAAGVAANGESIWRRIGPDRETAQKILQGHDQTLPYSSLKFRFHAQKFGLNKWLERPLMGWGTGSSKHLIATSGRPELWVAQAGNWVSHLHNTYLELLVRFGLLGMVLLSVAVWRLAVAFRAVQRAGWLPSDHVLLVAGCLGMAAIWGLTVFQLMTEEWRAYWSMVMGVGYTFVLNARPAVATTKG